MVAEERWSLGRGGRWGEVVAGERWSLRRGGRLRKVVATGGSTVLIYLERSCRIDLDIAPTINTARSSV